MNAEAAFASFRQAQVKDERLTVFRVALRQDTLIGVAERSFEPSLAAFAGEQELRLQVYFPEAARAWLKVGRAAVHATPQAGSEMLTEALLGEEVRTFDQQGDFVRVQLVRDAYVGWLAARALTSTVPQPTHRVKVLRGHVFTEPRVAAAVKLELAYGMSVAVEAQEDAWAKLRLPDGQTGFARQSILAPASAPLPAVAPAKLLRFATDFKHAPYLWGGRTAWGLDCSGFVQTVYAAHGVQLPRDADQQQERGQALEPKDARAGDLYFLPGHVMIALGAGRFIHANAQHMRVSTDDFKSDYGRSLEDKLTRAVRVLAAA